jgi:hypothetical protein
LPPTVIATFGVEQAHSSTKHSARVSASAERKARFKVIVVILLENLQYLPIVHDIFVLVHRKIKSLQIYHTHGVQPALRLVVVLTVVTVVVVTVVVVAAVVVAGSVVPQAQSANSWQAQSAAATIRKYFIRFLLILHISFLLYHKGYLPRKSLFSRC